MPIDASIALRSLSPMPLLTPRARPLFFSFASSASLTAAVVVGGAMALAVAGLADDLTSTLRGQDAQSARLAKVPHTRAPVSRADHVPAATALPGARPAPEMPSGHSAGATRTATAEARHNPHRAAAPRRRAHGAPKRNGAPSEQRRAARESAAASPAPVVPSTGSDAASARTRPPARSRSAPAPSQPAAHTETRSKARGHGHATQKPARVVPSRRGPPVPARAPDRSARPRDRARFAPAAGRADTTRRSRNRGPITPRRLPNRLKRLAPSLQGEQTALPSTPTPPAPAMAVKVRVGMHLAGDRRSRRTTKRAGIASLGPTTPWAHSCNCSASLRAYPALNVAIASRAPLSVHEIVHNVNDFARHVPSGPRSRSAP